MRECSHNWVILSMIPGFRPPFSIATHRDWTLKGSTSHRPLWFGLYTLWPATGKSKPHEPFSFWRQWNKCAIRPINKQATHEFGGQLTGDIIKKTMHPNLHGYLHESQCRNLACNKYLKFYTDGKAKNVYRPGFWQTPISLRVCLNVETPDSHGKPPFPVKLR